MLWRNLNGNIKPLEKLNFMSIKKLGLLFFCVAPLFCAAQFRKYSNEFLNIGVGARGLGMGGAQVATVNDVTAGYWNPAGLANVKDVPSVGVMHADYFSGIAKFDYLSLALPSQNNKRTLGFSLIRFAVDDIPNTLYLVEPDGSVNYGNVQSFSNADWAFLFSYAQNIKKTASKTVSFGINTKIIHRTVGSFAKAWGFGLDAGLQMHGKNWHAGFVAKDLTTTFNAWKFTFTEREKEILYLTNNEIPIKSTEITAPRLTIGGGYDIKIGKTTKLLAEANLDATFDGERNTLFSKGAVSIDPRAGLELNFNNGFFVRGGITNFQRALADGDTVNQKKVWIYQPSLGAGFKLNNVYLDYAFTNLANQNSPLYTHVFSLRLLLDKKNKTKK